jgi:hypothetical protein
MFSASSSACLQVKTPSHELPVTRSAFSAKMVKNTNGISRIYCFINRGGLMANYKIKCEAIEVRSKSGICPGSAKCQGAKLICWQF